MAYLTGSAITALKGRHAHIISICGATIALGFAAFLMIAPIAGRLYLPVCATDHVNNTLNNIKGYTGFIFAVDIHLYRCAYTIHNLKLSKNVKSTSVPFLDIKNTNFSVQ